MAHPLAWPGKYFFYPIGNTSAACLTRDLAPEEPANILLLGCGDPRNVLFTIFCEPENGGRKLDFTCCDIDPAVLARNVLLLAMVADENHYTTVVWNIFFHIKLDNESHSTLVRYCEKLLSLSETLQHWRSSPYGHFIKMCTEHTLTELRRHWTLYVNMHTQPQQRIAAIDNAFTKESKRIPHNSLSWLRSSGPSMVNALLATSDTMKLYPQYWKTGTTFVDSKQINAAKLLNPTFAYSLAGEGCNVHYGTDPFVPFHLAEVFGNMKGSITALGIVKEVKAQFNAWCTAFHTSVARVSVTVPIVRFFVGEATAVCRSLGAFAMTGTLKLGVPVSQWTTELVQLSEHEYMSDGASSTFNVVDTSNLHDHIGLFNTLIVAIPLLSISTLSSVLYTESLLFRGEDATKEFADALNGDITTVSFLIGLCPVDYLSGFSSRCNSHELLMHKAIDKEKKQFHQVTTWKFPASGDTAGICGVRQHPPVFDPYQLGTLLYDIYHQIFEQEDAMTFARLNSGNMLKAISHSNIIHCTREGFVLFLKLVKGRLCISDEHWMQTMDRFIDLQETDKSMPMDANNRQEFCAQLYRHGVYTVGIYDNPLPKIGRFSDWDNVPPLVRVILTVPREKLEVLESSLSQVGTPPMQCDVGGVFSNNIFTSIHVAFGRVIPMGSKSQPWVIFEEDPQHRKGTSPLVVSFVMPAFLLTAIERMGNLKARFKVRSTTGTVSLMSKLGIELSVFTAEVMDESHVYIVPERPLPSRTRQIPPQTPPVVNRALISQIGESGPAIVELDTECELVASLTSRVSVLSERSKLLFGSGSTPQIAQLSPCTMRISIGDHVQDIVYPFPVIGSENKLRLARKSLYIEVVVPVYGPFKPDGFKLNPFPVIRYQNVLNPWNIHRLNLSRLPILDIKATKMNELINAHVASMMSTRERSLRKKHKSDALTCVKDTLHAIFVRSAGVQGGPRSRLFALIDEATKNCDTLFFISDLKFDLQSHTMVCEGFVLSLTDSLMDKIVRDFERLLNQGNMTKVPVYEGEMKSWKQLIPAFVERCRSWKHRENCEYRSEDRVPLTEVMEVDPLCSCGRGKDVEGMHKVDLWSKFAPYVTRIAMSPLFAVSYLETVGRDPSAHRCKVCRAKGKPKLYVCVVCKKVKYCSQACQRKDWKSHKPRCKA